jgi:hypothetical protein
MNVDIAVLLRIPKLPPASGPEKSYYDKDAESSVKAGRLAARFCLSFRET